MPLTHSRPADGTPVGNMRAAAPTERVIGAARAIINGFPATVSHRRSNAFRDHLNVPRNEQHTAASCFQVDFP